MYFCIRFKRKKLSSLTTYICAQFYFITQHFDFYQLLNLKMPTKGRVWFACDYLLVMIKLMRVWDRDLKDVHFTAVPQNLSCLCLVCKIRVGILIHRWRHYGHMSSSDLFQTPPSRKHSLVSCSFPFQSSSKLPFQKFIPKVHPRCFP